MGPSTNSKSTSKSTAKGARRRRSSSSLTRNDVKDGSRRDSSSTSGGADTSTRKQLKRKGQSTKALFSGKRLMFLLGTMLGLVFAHYFANHGATVDIAGVSQQWLLEHKDMLPPALIDLLKQARSASQDQDLSDDFAVGMHMYDEGYRPKHPVIMVPGVISSGLEDWGLHGTEECPSKPHYRKQLWGGFYMIRTMLLSKKCWLQHLLLDKNTGLDPPEFKVRAAQGIESADYFITGYWIWNKIVQNLAALGYDPDSMRLASYDWRLGYPDLERRDGYFSELKARCELNLKLTGQKTSMFGHSMGSQVIFYFLKWVEAEGPDYGNGGSGWVNKHIAHFVDISGSMLGTPKALVALLSGEMKDTVTLNQLAVQGLEKFFSRDVRADMLRTWPGVASMLPKGGKTIWGDMSGAPDDPPNTNETFGSFIRFTDTVSELSAHNLTLDDSIELLYKESPDWFTNRVKNMYSLGLARTRAEVKANEKDPSKWSNPLEAALPNAPDLEYYAFYGVGKDTERAYHYRDSSKDDSTPLNVVIDYDNLERASVVVGPGDGTISLPTHTMSHRWKDVNSKFNPGGVKIKVVEMLHNPDTFDLRGGAQTAEHVDILGRSELNELLLRVASGHGDELQDRYESNINDWVWDLDLGE